MLPRWCTAKLLSCCLKYTRLICTKSGNLALGCPNKGRVVCTYSGAPSHLPVLTTWHSFDANALGTLWCYVPNTSHRYRLNTMEGSCAVAGLPGNSQGKIVRRRICALGDRTVLHVHKGALERSSRSYTLWKIFLYALLGTLCSLCDTLMPVLILIRPGNIAPRSKRHA